MHLPFKFPSRAKKKFPSGTTTRLNALQPGNLLPDMLWTSIYALKESADAFPPLKSVVSGVIAVYEIAERAKHSKADAHRIAVRITEILDLIAEAAPDPLAIEQPMLQSIERFTLLLDEIRCPMEAIAFTGALARLGHLNRNELMLQEIKARLDDAKYDFLAASVLRQEVQQAQLIVAVKDTLALAPQVSRLLIYSRVTVFLAVP
ncbi:hypothetical protein B0H17DRAFT_292912 [Mycena rosella]|uniref:Uncharacterized protein n=1 Tax=Mycena rosella TaxID=1033263 RepID=A0AAD7CUW8_MYCRO|nr:hypothetical protein B0H17DRAFT_292912 [Mycena rosella]